MHFIEPKHPWEHYPEYLALQQYSRCLGGVLAGLPRSVPRIMAQRMIQAATRIGMGFVGAHAQLPPGEATREEREDFLETAFRFIAVSREGLQLLREAGGDAAGLTAAVELLERVETGLRDRPLPT